MNALQAITARDYQQLYDDAAKTPPEQRRCCSSDCVEDVRWFNGRFTCMRHARAFIGPIYAIPVSSS